MESRFPWPRRRMIRAARVPPRRRPSDDPRDPARCAAFEVLRTSISPPRPGTTRRRRDWRSRQWRCASTYQRNRRLQALKEKSGAWSVIWPVKTGSPSGRRRARSSRARAHGKAQPSSLADLVERFARRVVARLADQLYVVGASRDRAPCARPRREGRNGCSGGFVGERRGVDVPSRC